MAISKSVLLLALCLAVLCAVSYATDADINGLRRFDFDAFDNADEVSDEEDEVPVANEEVRHFAFDFFEENEEDVDDNAEAQIDLSEPARRFDFDQFDNNVDEEQEGQNEDRKRNARAVADDEVRRFPFDEFEENTEDVDPSERKPLQFDVFSDPVAATETEPEADAEQAHQKRELPAAQPAASPRSKFTFRKLW